MTHQANERESEVLAWVRVPWEGVDLDIFIKMHILRVYSAYVAYTVCLKWIFMDNNIQGFP